MATTRTPYPAAAAGWMVGDRRARVLDLGSGTGGFAAMVQAAGHDVFCIDRHVDQVAALVNRLGTRLHVVGQVESLPYLSCHFEVVTAAQTLHLFAPGLALSEIARVLKPGGRLAVAYNTRDDTVPWVKRLTAVMRQADPEAMTGDYGVDSVEVITDSPYFRDLEHRTFRNWIPITRPGLLAMVERRLAAARVQPEDRDQLLRDVGELYDTSARPPEPLLLPYQASCWRAVVDHAGLVLDDEAVALQIRL